MLFWLSTIRAKGLRADLGQHRLVPDIEGRLVDQADLDALGPQLLDRIEAAIEHLAVADDIAGRALADDLVLARHEGVALAVEFFAVLLEDERGGGAGREDETQAGVVEDRLQHRLELQGVGREVEPGQVALGQAVVGEEVVDAEMAGVVGHVVDPGVGEVGEDIGLVEAGHGDFGDHHLEKGGEGAEDPLPARLGAETGGHREVVALHDAAVDIDLGIVLADMVQAAGAFEVGIDDDDLFPDIVHPRRISQTILPKSSRFLAVSGVLPR